MTAFFDLTERLVHLLDEKSGRLMESIPFEMGEGLRIGAVSLPAGVGDCYVSLPLRALNFRVLEMPLADMDSIKQVLPFELDGLILGEPAAFVFDARAILEQNGGKRVLAVFIGKPALRGLLESLRAMKLDPKVVTSIDLRAAIDGGPMEEISRRLLEHEAVLGEERINLALKELEGPTVNMRTGEFSFTGESEKTGRSLRVSLALAAALLIVISAGVAIRAVSVRRENAALRVANEKIYSETFPGEKTEGVAGLTIRMKSHLKAVKDKEANLSGVSPLELLLGLQGSGRKLRLTEISLDGGIVALKGEAASLSEVQEIKSSLEGFLSDVGIAETGQSARDKVLYTITSKGGASPKSKGTAKDAGQRKGRS